MAASEPIAATRTTTQLLDALRDHSNEPAWGYVDSRYRPVIVGFARRLGLSDSDAEDVSQQTLTEFVTSFRAGKYSRGKGRLSSWILGIAHHLCLKVLRRRSAPTDPRSPAFDQPPDEQTLRLLWTRERDRVLLMRAFELLASESDADPKTLLAFELYALRGVPADQAAMQCGMSLDQLYVAKSRVSKRLRVVLDELTRAFEEDE
jgi:RNA polymerase sigma-70 factor (ECF subfamily)